MKHRRELERCRLGEVPRCTKHCLTLALSRLPSDPLALGRRGGGSIIHDGFISLLPHPPSVPFCLFLDVDGTLLDIAGRPDGVVVSPVLRQTLGTLNERLEGAVALVSGRAISDIDGLFAPLRLRASGVHGAEMRFDPNGGVEVSPEYHLPEAVVAGLRAIAERHPGTLVEDKRFSVAVHYRAVPAAGSELENQLAIFLRSPECDGCRILPGHMVFEIKRSGFNKGAAVGAFMSRRPFEGRQPIFIGDDVTDLPGFTRALAAGGLAYSVTTPRTGVSAHFADPDAVRSWLRDLAVSLG